MDKQMSFRGGQWLSRLARRLSLAGDGLPERMRSTTFALLGITAATCLGLVAVFSQQEWPLLSPGPVPAAPAGPTAVGDAAIVPNPSGGVIDRAQREPAPRVVPVFTAPVDSSLSEQDGDAAGIAGQSPPSQAPPSVPDAPQPAEPPEPQQPSPAQPPAAAPAPSSEPAPAAPAPVPPVVATPELPEDFVDKPGNGKGNGYGHLKSGCPDAYSDEVEDEDVKPPASADKNLADPEI
jgi:hypothetical protein